MNFADKTVAFHTLGCKLNFAETSAIARQLTSAGFKKSAFESSADVYVINTCSVTENADRECRSVVRSALSRNPEALIAITGCYAQLKPDDVASIPGVDIVLGAKEKFNLLSYLDFSGKLTTPLVRNCDIEETNHFVSAFSAGDRTRSFLKVQDGCDYSCTFCTIPLARGKSRSDTIENVIANAKQIAATGVKEIVLTGVNLGDFGYTEPLTGERKSKEYKFLDLIKRLDVEIEGIDRFRISSIEPNLLSEEIIKFVASSKKFVPHFRIPLQSGSDDVLKKMKRRYLSDLYRQKITLIKSLMPHCCIGVDVIVGFPGETENHFNETVEFLKSLDISYLHVFTYSERENTPAAGMEGVVSIPERKRRNKVLRMLSSKKLHHFYHQYLGSTQKVLFESEKKGGFISGYSRNYIRVKLPFDEELSGKEVKVQLLSTDEEGSILATVVGQNIAVSYDGL